MNIKEFTQMLDGREYGAEITQEEEALAKALGFVVVFGYSDDNAEFRGAINDEVGCYNGGLIHVTREGLLQMPPCDEYTGGGGCPYFNTALGRAAVISAKWSDKDGVPWSYETEIPHEVFNIYEDGELYCEGIVFNLLNASRARV